MIICSIESQNECHLKAMMQQHTNMQLNKEIIRPTTESWKSTLDDPSQDSDCKNQSKCSLLWIFTAPLGRNFKVPKTSPEQVISWWKREKQRNQESLFIYQKRSCNHFPKTSLYHSTPRDKWHLPWSGCQYHSSPHNNFCGLCMGDTLVFLRSKQMTNHNQLRLILSIVLYSYILVK